MTLEDIIRCARGHQPADLLLTGGRILNVFDGDVLPGNIAIKNGLIAGIGDYQARHTVDLGGRIVVPGLIDAHVHIESAMTGVGAFANAIVPHGTTAVVADPHEIANVLGADGIRYMLATSAGLSLNVYFMLSSCVPATDMETGGARLTVEDLRPFIREERILGLAEMMNFPGVLSADPAVLSKIAMAREARKPIDGHSPGLTGAALNAYVAAGISSDHECTTLPEAREKLRAGMHIMVREGTAAKNLAALLPLVDPRTCRRMMWCTDDRHSHDLLTEGHIDFIVRSAVRQGLDPVIAIQMATLNPAEYFGLNHLGAVAPGRQADLLVIDDLKDFNIIQVYNRGQLVADRGRMLGDHVPPEPVSAPRAMNVIPEAIDFSIPARGRLMRVIDIVPDQIITREVVVAARIEDDLAVADPLQDILKIAVVDRYSGTGRTGLAFVRGLGLKSGAIASSVAHDAHKLLLSVSTTATCGSPFDTVVDAGAVSRPSPKSVPWRSCPCRSLV